MRTCVFLLLSLACSKGDTTVFFFDRGPEVVDAGISADAGVRLDAAPDAVAPPEPAVAPTVQVGTGRGPFVPIDSEVQLIRGPQAGYHVWVSSQIYDWVPGVKTQLDMQVQTRFPAVAGSLVQATALAFAQLGEDAQGVSVRSVLGWPAAIYQPECAHGKELEITVSFVPIWEQDAPAGSEGVLWTGTSLAVVQVPEQYRQSECSELSG